MLLYLKRAGNTMERSLIFRGYPLQDIMPRRAENNICAGVMELADVTDSKSVGSNTVWVRVPPPAPNTEAPVGCLCVWLSRTGLEAGETKRSCGAFCPAGERKQSGRAARSASKGRFERRVPPPAPWRVFLQHLRSCEDTRFFSAQTAGLSSVV